jgi:nucleoside-diphosphate-sugar epimerase
VTRVVVTGAAGFIGSHLVEALAHAGHDVVGVDNFDPFYPREVKERNLADACRAAPFRFVEADVAEPGALASLLDRDAVVVHLAAKAGVRPSIADPAGYARANVTATAAVAEAMRRAGARRLVFGSSSSVYGDDTPAPFREDAPCIAPVSPYAATKRAAELLLTALAPIQQLTVASLRFFTVYGPRQRPDLAIHSFTRAMAEGRTITLFGDGRGSRDYTWIDDIVAGALAAVRWTEAAPPGVTHFNLGGNRAVPLRAMVEEIAAAMGVTPSIAWAPMQPGDVQHTSADLARSGAVLGYAPRTPFPEGIRRFVEWYRSVHARER